MLRTILLAFFLVVLCTPAVAMTAPGPADKAAMSMVCHETAPDKQHGKDTNGAPAMHKMCIGCIALPAKSVLSQSGSVAALAPSVALPEPLHGVAVTPSIPPPRL